MTVTLRALRIRYPIYNRQQFSLPLQAAASRNLKSAGESDFFLAMTRVATLCSSPIGATI
jgi:hypothetical protein